MSQQEINEEILTILTALIHSDDNYKRECVDLNANAFLMRLKDMILPPKVSEPLSKEELLDMVERGEIVLAPKPRTPIVPRYLGDEDDDSLPRTKKCIDCDEVLSRGFDFYLGDPGEKPEGPFCWTCLNKRP